MVGKPLHRVLKALDSDADAPIFKKIKLFAIIKGTRGDGTEVDILCVCVCVSDGE